MKIIEKLDSKVNGEISVYKDFGLGTFVQVEGLTQSGSVVWDVWKTTLSDVKKTHKKFQKCLVLGLGAGSAAILVRKFWPDIYILGVDIDEKMVSIGKRYMKLDNAKN